MVSSYGTTPVSPGPRPPRDRSEMGHAGGSATDANAICSGVNRAGEPRHRLAAGPGVSGPMARIHGRRGLLNVHRRS